MVTNISLTSSPELAAQNVIALKQALSSLNADSCPHDYNFHMHTVFSDGKLKPEELIEQAVVIGLKGLAITDHHNIGGYQVAQSWLNEKLQESSQPLPHLWTGTEITAELLNIEVHILGYAFDPQHPVIQPYLQGKAPSGEAAKAVNVISAFHQAGGLAVLAHPARYRRPAKDLIPQAAALGIDGVETYYAYNNPHPWQPSPKETEQVKQLAAAYNLLNTCGTDTHGLNLLQRL